MACRRVYLEGDGRPSFRRRQQSILLSYPGDGRRPQHGEAITRGKRQPKLSAFIALAWALLMEPRELFETAS